jgi:hypothetical protein
MNRLEFLRHTLPSHGIFCAVAIAKGKAQQTFVNTIEEIDAWSEQQPALGKDAYFSLATYKTNERFIKNTELFKSLWVDLDVGKGTDYPSQLEAMIALKNFVHSTGLPKPTVVSSGFGLHIYWSFIEVADYNGWYPLAKGLVAKTIALGFSIKDRGLTTDGARILRIPETTNFKGGLEADVKLLHAGTLAPIAQYQSLLQETEMSLMDKLELAGGTNNVLNETTRALLGNTVHKFSIIMRKSLVGKGCAHMAHVYNNADEISEPHWRAALSIARYCTDNETAIHKISNRHSEYDPAETERKAQGCEAPQLCSTFETCAPALCEGCIHKGKIKTPISLGKDILEALPSDNIITSVSPDLGRIDIEIPAYPFPYFRGPNGGVYIKKPLEDMDAEEEDKNLVYENDLYVVGRRTDPDAGEVIHLRLIRPHDGVSDFIAPLATVTAGDKCRDMLSKQGVAANTNQMKGLSNYLVTWTKHLQNTSKAELVRTQFGWSEGDKSFVIGSREFTKNAAPRYSPPSETTENIVPMYSKMGCLEEWSRVANSYALKGNEVRAFGLFLSLGAPMFKFFSLGGAIVHLTNASSGVGKSTIQKVACSVWGHPDLTMLVKDDTMLSKYQRMGVVNNMILCMDEVTNMKPDAVSDFAFGVTNGRGRNRQQAAANAERVNKTKWSLPCITSGNNSLHEVLQTDKADPEGEKLRVLEIEVVRSDTLTKQETDQLFSVDLMENYGLAGEVMMQYVLDNYDECRTELAQIQIDFDRAANLKQPERYYSALCATAMWGGKVANDLGLVNIPVKPVFDRMVRHLNKKSNAGLESQYERMASFLGAFLSEHIQNQLIINSAPSAIEGMLTMPMETPRGPLAIRREPDANRAYIISATLKSWCAKKQVSYTTMIEELTNGGLILEVTKVRMSAGTPQDSPGVLALVLDSTKIV